MRIYRNYLMNLMLTPILNRYIPNRYIGEWRHGWDFRRETAAGTRTSRNYPPRSKGSAWLVPSQSGHGKYTVCPDAETPHCTCPDHETRGVKCKHIFAVEFVVSRERNADGTTTVTQTRTYRETNIQRTYPQNWTAYNAAQTHEKARFLDLLRDLCAGLSEPEKRTWSPAHSGAGCGLFRLLQDLQYRIGPTLYDGPAGSSGEGLHCENAALQFDLQRA